MGCNGSKYADPEQPDAPEDVDAADAANDAVETSAQEELIALKLIADAEHASFEELEGNNDATPKETAEIAQEDATAAAASAAEAEAARAAAELAKVKAETEALKAEADKAKADAEAEKANARAEAERAIAARAAADIASAEATAAKAEAEAAKAAAAAGAEQAEQLRAQIEADAAKAKAEVEQAKADAARAADAKLAAEKDAELAQEEAKKRSEEAEMMKAEAEKAKADMEIAEKAKQIAEDERAAAQAEALEAKAAAEAAAAKEAADAAAAKEVADVPAANEVADVPAANDAAEAVTAKEVADGAAANEAAETAAAQETSVTAQDNDMSADTSTPDEKDGSEPAQTMQAGEVSSQSGAASGSSATLEENSEANSASVVVRVNSVSEENPAFSEPSKSSPPKKNITFEPSDMSRKDGNDAANNRMFKEMASIKRRENSLMNRKKAAAFAIGVAGERKMSFGGSGVLLGANKQTPLVVRKSVKKQSKMQHVQTSTSAKTLAAELSQPPSKPSLLGTPKTSAAGGGPRAKKSVRKSIRAMFKSTRKARPQKPISESSSAPVAAASSPKRKPGAVTVAEIEAGLPADDLYEQLDPRAVDAARWTDKVVVQLIGEIQKHGKKNGAGQYCISFGELFEETANIFDALVGIIKTAKKYHVLHVNKDQLWQGQDDNEVITLLKETHSGVLINRRLKTKVGGGTPAKSKGFGTVSLANQNQKCFVCGKTVYPMEFVGASDKAFHKNCFRCKTCNCVLKSNDYCNVKDEFYCPTHYKELINLAGGAGNEAL